MDLETTKYISEEVDKRIAANEANARSVALAAEVLAREALRRNAENEKLADRAVTEAEEAHNLSVAAFNRASEALDAKVNSDQHILDLVWSKFPDFFHATLLRYTDYTRSDYNRTLRDWAYEKFQAWKGTK